jgi:hypothetical protein
MKKITSHFGKRRSRGISEQNSRLKSLLPPFSKGEGKSIFTVKFKMEWEIKYAALKPVR